MTISKDVAVDVDLAVRRIIARYSHLVDDGDFEAAAELFAEDGRFRLLDQDLRGRPAIRDWLSTIPTTLFHHVTNVVVSNGSRPDSYHAVSDVMVGARGEKGWTIQMLGRYHDTLAGDGRNLVFGQRILTTR